jgi:PKD repeat protein
MEIPFKNLAVSVTEADNRSAKFGSGADLFAADHNEPTLPPVSPASKVGAGVSNQESHSHHRRKFAPSWQGRSAMPNSSFSIHLAAKGLRLTILLLFFLNLYALADIIPSDRVTVWQGNVGVPGGIPNRTTIYNPNHNASGNTFDASQFGNGASDAGAAVNTAVANCPANQVVKLGAGLFLWQNRVRSIRNNWTFRGTVDNNGNQLTRIICGMTSEPFNIGGADYPYPSGGVAILSGATVGSSTFTVGNTATFTPGLLAHVVQDDPTWVIGHSAFGPNMSVTCKILSRSVNSGAGAVTLDHALPISFTLNPKLVVYPTPPVTGIGIEDVIIDCNNTAHDGVYIEQAWGCWFKNVEIRNSWQRQLFMVTFVQGEIRHCKTTGTIYRQDQNQDGTGGPNHEGIDFYNRGCWNLVEDNICDNGGFSSIVFNDSQSGAAVNVVGYNLIINVGTASDVAGSAINSHGGHSMFVLLEGNIANPGFSPDGLHGSSSHYTLARNWVMVKPYDGATKAGAGDSGSGHYHITKGLRGFSLDKFCNFYNVVGNVIGDSSFPSGPTGVYSIYNNSSSVPTVDYPNRLVYRLGFPNIGNYGNNGVFWGPNSPLPDYLPAHYGDTIANFNSNPFGAYQKVDLNVAATLLRHGNYDFFNHAIVWDGAIADHNIPNSYYLAAKPAWFGDRAWPPIDPTNAGSLTIEAIPAGYRYVHGVDPPAGGTPPNQPPTVSITGPADNAVTQAPGSFTITADASDTDGTVSKVEFYDEATKIGEDTSSPYSFSWTGITAGDHVVTAKATDNSAATNTSSAIKLHVGAVLGLSFASTAGVVIPPFNASGGVVSQASQTTDPTQGGQAIYYVNIPSTGDYTMSAMVNCHDTGSDSFFVQFDTAPTTSNIWKIAPTTGLQSRQVTWGFPIGSAPVATWTLSAGVHRLNVVGREADAKLGQITISPVVAPSNQAPTSGLSADVSSGVGPLAVTFTLTSADSDGTVASGVLNYGDGTTPVSITSPGASTTRSHTYATVGSQTTYNATWTVTDNSGAASSAATQNITVSPVPPPPPNQPPTSGISAVPLFGVIPLTVDFTLTSTDPDGTVASGVINYGEGAPQTITSPAASASRSHLYSTPGNYSVTWHSTDNNGADSAVSSATITVSAPPAVSITAPADSTTYSLPATVSITATASAAGGTITKVEFYQNNQKIGEDLTSPYAFSWPNVAAGNYGLTAKATDSNGLTTTSTPPIAIQVLAPSQAVLPKGFLVPVTQP